MQPPPRGRTESNRPPRCASIPSATILSATVRQVTGTDLIEETLGCLFDQTEDVGETIGSKIVRVGYLTLGRIGCEIQEGSHHSGTLTEGRDHPVVLLVHRQDVVEPLTISGVEKAGPLARDVYPARERALLRPRVRWLPGMVEAVGARRVNRYLLGKSLAPGDVLEDTLCHRTTTNVPRADEQDADHGHDSKVLSAEDQSSDESWQQSG